jgi:hypothetical protein
LNYSTSITVNCHISVHYKLLSLSYSTTAQNRQTPVTLQSHVVSGPMERHCCMVTALKGRGDLTGDGGVNWS